MEDSPKKKKKTIPNRCTSKPDIWGFAQITIGGNKLKLFVEILTLKLKAMSIPNEFDKVCILKS